MGPAGTGAERHAAIGLCVALLVVASQVAVPVPGLPAPLTLQTVAVALTGLCLGPRDGMLALCVYLGAGFLGFPVFAGGKAGLAVLGTPSLGYLLGFPLQAGLTGVLVRRLGGPLALRTGLAAAAGFLVTHAAGAAGIRWLRPEVEPAGLLAMVVGFLPGDAVKLAILVGVFPRLGPRLPPPYRVEAT